MDTEEFDLDTLVDLLDEDPTSELNEPCKTSDSNVLSPQLQHHVKNIKSTKSVPQKVLKNVSVDLFSTESSNIGTKLVKSDKNVKGEAFALFGSDSSEDEDDVKAHLTKTGRMVKKNISLKKWFDAKPQQKVQSTWKAEQKSQSIVKQKTASQSGVTEEFSGIRIINPLVPHNVLQSRMNGRRMIKMSFMKNHIRNDDIEGDWVTMGVLVNKLPPKTSKNGKTYSIWRMSDLHDVEKIISVFLFGAAHVEHWKTAIATVVGILNPSFLPNKEKSKSADICLSVDQPAKFMIMGSSRDFGHCKSIKRDGTSCTNLINKSQCEYCTYHISQHYKKLSSKRIELQASYSGRPVDLKKKVLNKSNVMYGGQLFCSPNPKPLANSRVSKDKLTLNGLGLKRKAEEIEQEQMSKRANNVNLAKVHDIQTDKVISTKSDFINQQLAKPSIGSRNLFQHLVKAENANIISKSPIISITPKELLKMHANEMKNQREKLVNTSLATVPQLGRGLRPGGEISFTVNTLSTKKASAGHDLNKLRAIRKIQMNGPIKSQNPNAVKNERNSESIAKVQSVLEKDDEKTTKTNIVTSALGAIDLSSEKMQRILERKSSHAYEIEIDELERLEKYFNNLEMKEKVEEKMLSTFKIVCNVVSCQKCQYTAQHAADRCKSGGHPLVCHTATKRFFACVSCKYRTCAFTKLPKRPCRKCGEKNFEKTSIIRPRLGPQLDSEKLSIRGDEIKFIK